MPHPVQPLSTLRTPRCRDARKTRSRPACSALNGPDFHWQAHSSFPLAPRTGLLPKVGRDRPGADFSPLQRRSAGGRRFTDALSGAVSGACLPSALPPPGPFPPRPPPPLIAALFGRFTGSTRPSDSSPVPRQLRLLAFLSRPGIAVATAGQTRPPRFRRVPFCVMWSSTTAERQPLASRYRPCCLRRSLTSRPLRHLAFGLNTYPTRSLCTLRSRRRRRPATLVIGRPLRLTRAGLPPAGSRQLPWRTRNQENPSPFPWSSLDWLWFGLDDFGPSRCGVGRSPPGSPFDAGGRSAGRSEISIVSW